MGWWQDFKGTMKPVLTGESMFGQTKYQATGTELDQTQANQDLALGGQSREAQQRGLSAYQEAMAGNAPSVAALQQRQGVAQAMQNAATQAANARGMSRALAQREAMYAGQGMQRQAVNDASMLRAQEIATAREGYGGMANALRGADIQQRGQSLEAAAANQQASMEAQRINAQLASENATRQQKGTGALMSSIGGFIQGAKGTSDIRAKTEIRREPSWISRFSEKPDGMSLNEWISRRNEADDTEALTSDERAKQRLRLGGASSASSTKAWLSEGEESAEKSTAGLSKDDMSTSGGTGGVKGAVGGAVKAQGNALISDDENVISGWDPDDKRGVMDMDMQGVSDMRAKDIDSRRELEGVKDYSYEYKDNIARRMADEAWMRAYRDAKTPRMGVMAQDLEHAGPMARSMVGRDPDGMRNIDLNRGVSFSLAAAADLNERLKRLESRQGTRGGR